jgi:hypothetical protein
MKHQALVTGIADLLEQSIAHSDTDIDDLIVSELQTALVDINVNAEPDQEKLIKAVFAVLEEIASFTPTETDDKILQFAEILFGTLDLGDKLSGWYKEIREKGKARRAKRRED